MTANPTAPIPSPEHGGVCRTCREWTPRADTDRGACKPHKTETTLNCWCNGGYKAVEEGVTQ